MQYVQVVPKNDNMITSKQTTSADCVTEASHLWQKTFSHKYAVVVRSYDILMHMRSGLVRVIYVYIRM